MVPCFVSTSGCDGTSPFVTGSGESLDSMTGIFSSRADLRFKNQQITMNSHSYMYKRWLWIFLHIQWKFNENSMKILIISGVRSCLFQMATSWHHLGTFRSVFVECMTLSLSVTLSITHSSKQTSRLSPKDDLLLQMVCSNPRIGTNL